MINSKYAEAYAEVLDVLNHMSSNDIAKVSDKFITFLKENASATYVPNLDYSKKLKDMDLKEETRGVLAILYEKYWCPEDKKQELIERYNINEEIYQRELINDYEVDDLFKKFIKNEEQMEEKEAKDMLVVAKKENIFRRIWKKILKNINR